MGDDNRRRLLDGSVAVLLGGGAFTLYVLSLAPTLLAGDGGEFQFVPYLLGVAHPTGYPLYCLLGWVWSRLLWVGDVAYRMNLFSAFWAALAVGFLYPTARILLKQVFPHLPAVAHRLLAVLAAASLAVTPTFWSQAIIAEVYSLHVFLVVLIFYFLLTLGSEPQSATTSTGSGPDAAIPPAGGIGGEQHLLLMAGCLGFGLTHHRSTVLLIPAILAYLWLVRPRFFRDRHLVLKALLLVLLPLSLYLYIPWRAAHTPYLRLPLAGGRELVLYENTPAGFLDFVLGGPFGGSVDLSADLGTRLPMAWGFVRDEIGWIGLALVLLGIAWLSALRRWPLLVLTGLAAAVLVAFNLVYTIGDIYVLYVPVYLIMILWLVIGAGTLVQVIKNAWARFSQGHVPWLPAGSRKGWIPTLVPLATVLPFFVLPLWMAGSHYADLDQSRNTGDRERWEDIMAEPLPANAILITNDRDDIMPMWYLQYVGSGQPVRTDLLGLYPLITADYPTLGYVLDLALSTGRPVYLIKEMPGIEVKVNVDPEGGLWYVPGLTAGPKPGHLSDASLADVMALSGYDRTPHSPRPGESLTVSLYWEALQPAQADYHSFVHLLDSSSQRVAQSDHQPGGIYYPTSLWQPGERLRDDHVLVVPTDAPPGVYHLLVGMYVLSSDGSLSSLGAPVVLGQVGIKTGVQTVPGPISFPAAADLGPIELLGYDAEPQDDGLLVRFHWRCTVPTDTDYTVFVHLVDAAGNRIAQHDGQPQGGAYPTSIWDMGEVVSDEHLLSLPADLLAGDYALQAGLYRLETGRRLPVGEVGDDVGICGIGCVELRRVRLGH
jgi:hypothetical protein